MSEPEELSDSQIDRLADALRALLEEIEAQLSGSAEGAKPVELDQPIGRISRVDAMQQQQMVAATRRNLEVRLQQVRAALAAVDAGDYGYCRSCDEPIALGRLEVRPESPFCVRCQSRMEQR